MLSPSSDDGTAKSVIVGSPGGTPGANRVQITPNANTYFYSQFPCTNAKAAGYSGLSMRIKAPKGATLSVELDHSATCNTNNQTPFTLSNQDLGWTFDGTEKLYLIPFSKFSGLDTSKLTTLLFSGFSGVTTFGPIEFYCGSTGEYIPPATTPASDPSSTVAAPSNTAAALLTVDKFANADSNALGFWHGADDGMNAKISGGKLVVKSNDSDYSWYTQLSTSCSDFTKYKGSYLHIAYSGPVKFTVALQQNNPTCDNNASPSPQTWDSAEASRYANNGHIYIPMNHFNIDFTKTIGFALKGFYSIEAVTISLIEIVSSVPAGTVIPSKDQTGDFVFSCKRPNSFAFAIDDGDPTLAQEVLKVIRANGIKVTFFTVGAALDDPSTNLTNVYNEMKAAGHQLAMHSYTHPKMEGLPDYNAIDWEYNNDIAAMKRAFNGFTTKYFRPPFGTEGARMRSRLTNAVGADATITEWSVDVEDWMWALSSTPEQQKVAFQRDVNAGGNLVVMHYLYPTTVSYLQDFINIAKATGKQLMRVDQCMMDPNAPPLD